MDRIVGDIEEGDINASPTSDESGGTNETKVDKLVSLITEKQAEVHPFLSPDFCIFRVPQDIREINTKAYDPRVVSIGPFHHGNVRYKSMEVFKMRCLNKVVQRSTGQGIPLKSYVQFLKAHETKVRHSYSETIDMDSDKFLKMLLLDSCFIIELLLCFSCEAYRDADFYILTSLRMWGNVLLDLILFENQIPFFVLKGLFSLAMTDLNPIPLIGLAIDFFYHYNPQKKSAYDIKLINHFTDLILLFHLPMTPNRAGAGEFQFSTFTITELDEGGVKLKISPSKCLLDIKFSNGVLEIPCIRFDYNMECIVRNLSALETCNYFEDSYMTDYLVFLDNLVNTPKDVDLLVKIGIIENCLGDSKHIMDIINNMNLNMMLNIYDNHFTTVRTQLNEYCKIRRHKWRAALKRDYFSSPWRSASTCAAIFLLALTLIQTILSIESAPRGE